MPSTVIEQASIERRSIDAAQSELRFVGGNDGKPSKVVGYAVVFNSLSLELGKNKREIIRPGAFTRSLDAGSDVVAKVDHIWPLARRSSGTLRLAEDEKGLLVEIDLPDTSLGRDTAEHMRRKDITGMSFAFLTPPKQSKFFRTDGMTIRELVDLDITDVSLVWQPAFPATHAELRSWDQWEADQSGISLDDLMRRQRQIEIEMGL